MLFPRGISAPPLLATTPVREKADKAAKPNVAAKDEAARLDKATKADEAKVDKAAARVAVAPNL
jgi:hypothetical protein